MPEPIVRVTEYAVSCVPEDAPGADLFAVQVEYCGRGRWRVTGKHRTLGADGTWSYGYTWRDGRQEPVTDDEYREYNAGLDAWITEHRHNLDTALRLAREAAPRMTVNGHTVTDALAQWTPGMPDAPDMWDSSVPPGGNICAVCGTPTESEPCRHHQPAASAAID